MAVRPQERHRTARVGWLRASVLGANDGILSTASLVLGVAAAHATHHNVMVAGFAGMVAGAMSMAAGEYVSVHSQADTEQADLKLERAELKADDEGEHKELMEIYIGRGLDRALAKQVAERRGETTSDVYRSLVQFEQELFPSRLAGPDTFCQNDLSPRQREWMETARPEAARQWNLLTNWKAEDLQYA